MQCLSGCVLKRLRTKDSLITLKGHRAAVEHATSQLAEEKLAVIYGITHFFDLTEATFLYNDAWSTVGWSCEVLAHLRRPSSLLHTVVPSP